MPKSTDITGTFRVPEEAWGKFWNLMLSIPGADVTPNTRVEQSPAKKRSNGKTSDGSTGKCLVLGLLAGKSGKGVVKRTGEDITESLVAAGKAKSSVPNILYELKKEGRIKGNSEGYVIAPAGLKYYSTNCSIK